MGGVKIQALEILTVNSTGQRQLSQGIFDGHMHHRCQLRRQIAGGSFLHQCYGGVQEAALAGKPRSAAQPDALGIKPRNGFQSVIAAAMGITGEVPQGGQFPKDGHVDLSAQDRLHLRHGDGVEAFKKIDQRFGSELDGSHIVRIPLLRDNASGILTSLENHHQT